MDILKKNYLKKMKINNKPKTWQFWIPDMGGFKYSIFYIPKIYRDNLFYSNFSFKMTYPSKGQYMFTVPSDIIPGIKKNRTISFSVSSKKNKFKLKSYITSLIVAILGLTFRFRVFLRVRGLGYKAYILNSGKTLSLKLGLSHAVLFNFSNDMHANKLGQKDRMFSIEGYN
jgi:ribosomal protein L6P/L9E